MRNNYKLDLSRKNMLNKRGQVSIFVIVAIVIVGLLLVYFLVLPKVAPELVPGADVSTPNAFLKDCIESDVKEAIDILSKHGGYAEPEGTILFNGTNIKYLCYTEENFKTCVVQEPFIKNRFESELSSIVKPKIERCFEDFEREFEDRGFVVSLPSIEPKISVVLDSIRIEIPGPVTIRKESTQIFDKFDFSVRSDAYDLLILADNIIAFETFFGDTNINEYIQLYPDMKIEKVRRSEGSTIYILTSVITDESFIFASRSLVWPPGWGIE